VAPTVVLDTCDVGPCVAGDALAGEQRRWTPFSAANRGWEDFACQLRGLRRVQICERSYALRTCGGSFGIATLGPFFYFTLFGFDQGARDDERSG
jgi:hypothetical protein